MAVRLRAHEAVASSPPTHPYYFLPLYHWPELGVALPLCPARGFFFEGLDHRPKRGDVFSGGGAGPRFRVCLERRLDIGLELSYFAIRASMIHPEVPEVAPGPLLVVITPSLILRPR